MHGTINVKSPNNTSTWQMGFNSAFKGLITNTGLENKAWNSPQIKILQQSHELHIIRLQTQNTVPENKHLKFLTSLTTSVDKTANLYGFHCII
jgi:adenine-specific DNA methylase